MPDAGASPREGRRHRLPRNLAFLALLLALLCVHFALLRAGLLLRNRAGAAGATPMELIGAFVVGLRFDFATACFLAAPSLALAYLPRVGMAGSRRCRRAFFVMFLALMAGLTLAGLAEYEFFHEFQTRYNQLAFQYLDQPATVAGMAWQGYPVFRYTAAWAVLTLAFGLGLRFALRVAYPAGPARPAGPVTEVASLVLSVGVLVVGMRGGFQGEPIRWGDAYRSDNDFANQLGLNGLYTLGRTALDGVRYRRDPGTWTRAMAPDAARRIAREMVVEDAARLSAAAGTGHPTVVHIPSGGGGRWLSLHPRDERRPVNVVLVIMESFSARFVGAVGAPAGFTPEFDRLAADGVLFTRTFSSGTHTHQGVFSTLLGFPNLPGHEYLMQEPGADQAFSSLPSLFKQAGYQTLFLYNGDFAWDNMRGFFRKQGIERFIGARDFPPTVRRDKVWGVADQDVFERANDEFDRAARSGPFLGVVLTLSNHVPFDLPPPLPFEPTRDMGALNRRLDGVRYADWALGRFVARARTLDYFDNTLFVFVGDHGFHVDPKLTEAHLLYHHVPLLFYAPGLMRERGVFSPEVAGQVNVAPTIVGLTGLRPASTAHWGRDLFDSDSVGQGFAIFKGSGGDPATAIVDGDDMVVVGASGKPTLWRYDLGFPPSATPVDDPEVRREMLTRLHAYVQASLADLAARRASAAAPPVELLVPNPGP